jgi:predicted HTH transcriptional regulator
MKQTETNRIEHKEKLTDDLEKGVVAFLNSRGGNIYIGIAKNGSVVGVSNPDKAQLQIKDRLRDNVRPSILGLFDILTEERDGKTIIVINLAGGTETPYYIKQKGRSEAGCFIRVGSSAQPMPE